MKLDINQIMQLMPHRYPFLLIDRVLSMEPDKSISALKNVTINEPFFPGHYPDHPGDAGRADHRGDGTGLRVAVLSR